MPSSHTFLFTGRFDRAVRERSLFYPDLASIQAHFTDAGTIDGLRGLEASLAS